MNAGRTQNSLAGVRAKLERADETLGCLDLEITAFLQEGPGPIVFKGDMTLFGEQAGAHLNRAVPRRFSILAGEVVHHLRSSMDYIVWELGASGPEAQRSAALEFPIFDKKPEDKRSRDRFARKLAGVPSRAQELIESLQPYRRTEAILTGPMNDPLMVIHDLDRIDKHRQLAIAISGFAIKTSEMAGIHVMLQRYAGRAEEEIAAFAANLDPNATLSPEVAFLDFGGRKVQPVAPGLSNLTKYVTTVVDLFDRECFSS